MSARGKHRSFKIHGMLTRGILAAGMGGVALALPLAVATCAQAATATTTDVQLITYKVTAGDTLAKIARKYPKSGGAAKLYAANRAVIGPDPTTLRPGLTLTVGTKTVQIPTKAKTAPTTSKTYANNLDGWIKHSLDIIGPRQDSPAATTASTATSCASPPETPMAINNWDSNAKAGIPSKGLLQVIDPTFKAYHVPGTSMNIYDPVANITAACNYAAAKYGSIDNVNGPY
jgi:SLT domain proteins